MPTTAPIIFIIDDDQYIRSSLIAHRSSLIAHRSSLIAHRSSLSRSLTKRGFVVVTFGSAQAFLDEHDPNQLGCIILDYGMPGMTGLQLQEELVSNGSTIPIIFITGHGGVPESVQAMKAGAIDFLEKPFRTEVLVERIGTALKMGAATSEIHEKVKRSRQRLDALTAREREIVDMIVSNPSDTTSKEIARALNISPRTVDHHRARIFEKTKVKSMVELIDLAISSKTPPL